MAHKKGVGSSKNGRESASQRLGVKIWGGQKILQVTLLSASAVRSIILERMLLLEKMIHCML